MPRWHDLETPGQTTPSQITRYPQGILPQEMRFHLKGRWRLEELSEILRELQANPIARNGQPTENTRFFIDGSQLESIDTASAYSFLSWLLPQLPKASHDHIRWVGLSKDYQKLVELLAPEEFWEGNKEQAKTKPGIVESIGRTTLENLDFMKGLISFFGETIVEMGRSLIRPRTLRIKELVAQLEAVGVNAIPIVALVTFLIGIVVAYLFGIQIAKYGANILIVDACAIAMCRELSPIITAIIIAGRSGSAFTAQLGAMRINEEVDALSVLGLSPVRVLILPRVLALMLTLPLLVFVGDVVGILGSMVIADLKLDITGVTFLTRLQKVLTMRSFFVGLIKAPVFAMFIGIIGCQMGLSIERDARSLGRGTTATVVRSIVAVILLNAGFAVLFSELKI